MFVESSEKFIARISYISAESDPGCVLRFTLDLSG